MNERIFTVNSEGETTDSTFLALQDQYKKLRENYNPGTFFTDMIKKMEGKHGNESGSPFIFDFIKDLDKESLFKLSKEFPEDDLLKTEVVRRGISF